MLWTVVGAAVVGTGAAVVGGGAGPLPEPPQVNTDGPGIV